MHFLKFLPLALLPVSLATPFVKRDAATINSDIGVISQKIDALNNSVTAYKGGNDYIGAFKIQNGASDLSKAINQTTNDAKASAPFTDDESATIGVAFLNLEPNIFSLLDNLKAKRPAFDSGFFPLSPIVLQTLKDQRKGASDLGAAIQDKLTPDFAAIAPQIRKEIDDKFQETINAYQFKFPGGK